MNQKTREPWPFFPEECRSHHPWRPGTVVICWDPCDCPAARNARGGHITVQCRKCLERRMRPLHQYTLELPSGYRCSRPREWCMGKLSSLTVFVLSGRVGVK